MVKKKVKKPSKKSGKKMTFDKMKEKMYGLKGGMK
jgi:hypothetical protein